MIIPSFKRLAKQDYPQDQQPFIEKLGFIINNSFDIMYEALNKKLTVRENFAGTLREVVVRVDADGVPVGTVGIALDTGNRVQYLQVHTVTDVDNTSVYPTAMPYISFTQTQTGLIFNHIAGLPAGTNFRLKLFAFT
jgi:hypothetical protein